MDIKRPQAAGDLSKGGQISTASKTLQALAHMHLLKSKPW